MTMRERERGVCVCGWARVRVGGVWELASDEDPGVTRNSKEVNKRFIERQSSKWNQMILR